MGVKKLLASWIDRLSRQGHEKRRREEERERAFLENGSKALEALIVSCNGRPIPIRTFSYEELRRATNNYDQGRLLDHSWFYEFYEGSFDGRTILVKTCTKVTRSEYAITDLATSAQASAHGNVLKLVGCCLENPLPTLVFESVQHGTLADRIDEFGGHGSPFMTWQSRLKVARDIAHAITYLHIAFSRPIIHRYINPSNIFFDQHEIPKLSGFSLSISIPEGETHVEDFVRGTTGYMCPDYVATGCITEKVDVYSFGMLLLVLLTGPRAYRDLAKTWDGSYLIDNVRELGEINHIVDPAIFVGETSGARMEQQLQGVLQLAFICLDKDPVRRPTMMDVTKELRRIGKSVC
ncbi:hypothetical protein CJ030_MR5G025015 [Morella rubra]|uniref:Protein kinase domain-containing protein n=1 Tax=Morella rubra TaxID=262757 RepID=A0A6A1VK10_9ROSI|nr:hypothetical protein CJ030_MR5G025015 [Morella rubra]